MRFNSVKTLIDFIKLLEGEGYSSSIALRDIKGYFNNLNHISKYSCLFETFGNLVLLTFYAHDNVYLIIEIEKKGG